jgi:hypothetical protein
MLRACGWNRSLAAYELGITVRTMRNTILTARSFNLYIPETPLGVMTVLPDEERAKFVQWAHDINMIKLCKGLSNDYDRKQDYDNLR